MNARKATRRGAQAGKQHDRAKLARLSPRIDAVRAELRELLVEEINLTERIQAADAPPEPLSPDIRLDVDSRGVGQKEPEFGAVLADALLELRSAESVTITVMHALRGGAAEDVEHMADTLSDAASTLTTEIDRLENAAKHARMRVRKIDGQLRQQLVVLEQLPEEVVGGAP